MLADPPVRVTLSHDRHRCILDLIESLPCPSRLVAIYASPTETAVIDLGSTLFGTDVPWTGHPLLVDVPSLQSDCPHVYSGSVDAVRRNLDRSVVNSAPRLSSDQIDAYLASPPRLQT